MNSDTELINVILEVIMQNPNKDINQEKPTRTLLMKLLLALIRILTLTMPLKSSTNMTDSN